MISNMSTKALTVSIVIPVYNEEHHIKRCLQAIAQQTVQPDEVIIVDNNCTDKTIAYAKEFAFVTVITEPRQGRAAARNAGFNVATGGIIGRIDADSVVAHDWVARLQQDFADESIAAVTGLARTDVLPRVHMPQLKTTIWCRAYYWTVHAYYRTVTTWGANMAVRREWWHKVKGQILTDDFVVHEDQDLGLLIAGDGGITIQDNKLQITTAGQSYLYFPKISHYIRLQTHTRNHHRQIGTFAKASFRRLGWIETLPGRAASVPFGIVFFCLSILFWPLDKLMIDKIGSAKWLR
jgi:glycosyltransferase involved in cell wall biosynthesis